MLIQHIQKSISAKKDILVVILLSGIVQTVSILLPGNTYALDSYEGYYLFLGNYPHNANPGWHEDAQGITHDNNNWFISQENVLWKIPVTIDLNSVSTNNPGVIRKLLEDEPALWSKGYNHFADPTYYEFMGQGYILVLMEEVKPPWTPLNPDPAVAVFRSDNLEYINHTNLEHTYVGQNNGLCVIYPQGNLYISDFYMLDKAVLNKYSVDWNMLSQNKTLILSNLTPVELFDENGLPTALESVQGGEISPSGELLYVIAGGWEYLDPSHGIHVFDLSTKKRVKRSTNGYGYFNYEWHPGPDLTAAGEEPEGLTIWDLDDGRAPGIRGQLHVIMLDNDWSWFWLDEDDVYLKHYTLNISVDKNYTGVEDGTPTHPFNTVNDAINFYPAWDGAQIKIKTGSYPETLSTSERVRIISDGGISTIGQ